MAGETELEINPFSSQQAQGSKGAMGSIMRTGSASLNAKLRSALDVVKEVNAPLSHRP